MNRKLKNYIDLLFEDVPVSTKSKELKEEMLANANDRYDDYVAMGKSDTEAYGLAVSSIGDVDDLLRGLKPTETQHSEFKKYRERNAKFTAIAVMMFILCPVALIWLTVVRGDPITGLCMLLLFVAIGVALLIYSDMTTPKEVKDYDHSMKHKDWDDEIMLVSKRNRSLCNSVRGLMWTIVTVVYLGVSFLTFKWHITWIIWLIGSVVDRMIMIGFQLKEAENEER